ncbi:hypothetical protein IAS59_006553 [Cryptococcus gattii]
MSYNTFSITVELGIDWMAISSRVNAIGIQVYSSQRPGTIHLSYEIILGVLKMLTLWRNDIFPTKSII